MNLRTIVIAALLLIPSLMGNTESVFGSFLNAQTARRITLSLTSDGKSMLEGYLPEQPSGRAIVDCPGGGYTHLSMQNEGHDWADFFNQQGIAYFVLTYRMPNGDRNIPLSDAYKAIATVRDSAETWHINPNDVGIMGFSAGGHLASTVCTHATEGLCPNFAILFYPIISMNENETHRGSVNAFLGQQRNDEELIHEFSNFNAVNSNTPPTIILLANDDRAVPPLTNAIAYYSAMQRAGNECTLLVYPKGGHGFGFKDSFPFHKIMLDELRLWLNNVKPTNSH